MHLIKKFSQSLLYSFLFLFLVAFATCEIHAQSKPSDATSRVSHLSAAVDTFNKRLPSEKLFVHTDKSFYAIGDTLWFKSYLFNGITGSYTTKSGIVYLDLISDSTAVTKSISVPAVIGLSWGQIILEEKQIREGFYTLRAYTNWMQNFGEEAFFTKRIYIADPAKNHWLVSQSNILNGGESKNQLNYSLQFKRADREGFGYKALQWQLTEGRKTRSKGTYEALNNTLEGSIDLNTSQGPLFMRVQEKDGEKQQLAFPLLLNPSPDIDLQFMPEGGYLVAGLPAAVAFKALDIYGKGINISGVVKNNRDETVAELETLHKGMGSFFLNPLAGESFYVLAKWGSGQTKRVEIPTVKASGSSLQVSNNSSDSLRVDILFSMNAVDRREYALTGFSAGRALFSATFKADRQRIRIRVPKDIFPSGIAHFTLFNSSNEPVNERITFINHKNTLNIQVGSAKEQYQLKDSIALNIRVTDKEGKPVQASLSAAVTDDSQVKADLMEGNIVTETLFGAELKGHIEEPAWYFSEAENTGKALDLLMLTQGWVGYQWKDIFNPAIKPQYAAQPELLVSGKVTNVLNKPVANAKMLLLAKGKYSIFKDTLTDAEGRFVFRDFPAVDTVSFVVQSRNARGKSFGIGLEMDLITPAPLTLKPGTIEIPWFVSSEPTSLQLLSNKQKLKASENPTGENLLKEVLIAGKRIIPKSKNLNGPGEADQIIDALEAQKAGSQPLLQFLQDHVKGFAIRPRDTDQFFYLNDKRLRFVVDGMELNRFYEANDPPILNQYYHFISDAMASLTADEVLGVEVMYSAKHTNKYSSTFLTIEEQMGNAGRTMPAARSGAGPTRTNVRDQFLTGSDIAYLEITTRSGNGIFFKKSPGIAVYRPLPLTWPINFYRPRYTTSVTSKSLDLRSTLHWTPNILTTTGGEGFTSFYSSENAGTYTVIIQGSDMGGLVGFKSFKIKVGN